MQNRKQTRTVLNPKQLQILSTALNKVIHWPLNTSIVLILLQAIYQTNEAIAQLVKDTGLTSAQVKTWFDVSSTAKFMHNYAVPMLHQNRRRVLRQNEFEQQRIAVERHRVRELWEDERARRRSRGLNPASEIPVDLSDSSRGSAGSWVAEAMYCDEIGRLEEPPTDDIEHVDEDEYLHRPEYNQPKDEFDDGDVDNAASQNGDHSSEGEKEEEISE
ncbi:hypothetical protein HHX47_DHR3000198 [Lentinula edodes]|nr:hypothetical protein HHX47_DHR3000198 [Lentinula edodes]